MPAPFPYYAALFAGILLGVLGQFALKAGAERSSGMIAQFIDPFTIAGFVVYALAAILYIIAIKRIPLSLAFPSVSLSYAAVAIVAHLVWGEPLGLPQLAGIALITGGIVLLHA
jgi:small multidrug resistance pump